MKIYTVYTNPKAKEPYESAVFVPEGFNWWALVFPINLAQAFDRKSWFFFTILFIYFLTGALGESMGKEINLYISILKMALIPFLGIWANDFWRASLKRRGFSLQTVVVAEDTIDAQRRFLEKIIQK